MKKEDLEESEKCVGQIFPVIKDQHGNTLDGFHRKRVNPNWREITMETKDELHALKIRIHANIIRRGIEKKEGYDWVQKARKLLNPNNPNQLSQRELAKILGVSKTWVQEHDTWSPPTMENIGYFYGYNVWGFKNESWRNLVIAGDPNQPDKEFYHGSTPAFVIRQLLDMFQPKLILDSMAGVGTTGYVCSNHNPQVECHQFDLYPYEKYGVQQRDAEFIESEKKYDLIFNHIPYLDMVKYGDHEQDLSTMNEKEFFDKLKRIFLRNYYLLAENGVYAILVGDWRFGGKLIPITAKTTLLAQECGFKLYDEAIKLTAEQKGVALQEYRASKFGYLAQTFDTVLIFRRA